MALANNRRSRVVEHELEDLDSVLVGAIHEVEVAINGHAGFFYALADLIQRVVVIINGLADAIYGHDGAVHAPEEVINEVADLIYEVEDVIQRLVGIEKRVAVSKETSGRIVLRQAGGIGPAQPVGPRCCAAGVDARNASLPGMASQREAIHHTTARAA